MADQVVESSQLLSLVFRPALQPVLRLLRLGEQVGLGQEVGERPESDSPQCQEPFLEGNMYNVVKMFLMKTLTFFFRPC